MQCHFLNNHNNHKIILIDDEESLKKENLSFDFTTKEFNEKKEKINNLKGKIEQEIININNSYDTIFNNISKSFELKHKQLYEKEKDLIETLQNEVTKIKEKLENFLFKKLENNNNENNKIKAMSYVSEMNKNQNAMNILNNQLMKNI